MLQLGAILSQEKTICILDNSIHRKETLSVHTQFRASDINSTVRSCPSIYMAVAHLKFSRS